MKIVITTQKQIDEMLNKKEVEVQEKFMERFEKMDDENMALRIELGEAKSLHTILDKLTDKTNNLFTTVGNSVSWARDEKIGVGNLPDCVPVYVDDLFGGKVIKQEATKAIRIDFKGNVMEGLTKQKPEKGYSYVLKREAHF